MSENKKVVLSFSNGLGNFILLSPTITALQENGWDVDIALGTNHNDIRRKEFETIIKHYDTRLEMYDPSKAYDEAFVVWGEQRQIPEGPNWKITKDAANPIEFFLSGKHEVELNFKIAEHLGITGPIPRLYFPRTRFDNLNWNAGVTNIGIHIGSRPEPHWKKKRWRNEYWTKVMNTLDECYPDIQFHMVMGEWEKDDCEIILEKTRPKLFTYNENTMTEISYLISKCDLMITTDSAPLHVAAAVGTPVIQIFSCTLPSKNNAWRAEGKVLKCTLDCSPCIYSPNFQTCTDHICMDKVSPDQVIETVFDYLPLEENK